MKNASLSPRAVGAPDLSDLPQRVDRRMAADLVTRFFFPVSARTIETWPLTVRRVNSRVLIETAELFAYAAERLEASPRMRGG